MRRLGILLLLVIIAGAVDIGSTTYGVAHSDSFEESNPTVEQAMGEYGVLYGHILLKLLVISLFIPLSLCIDSPYKEAALIPPILLWGGAGIANILLII